MLYPYGIEVQGQKHSIYDNTVQFRDKLREKLPVITFSHIADPRFDSLAQEANEDHYTHPFPVDPDAVGDTRA